MLPTSSVPPLYCTYQMQRNGHSSVCILAPMLEFLRALRDTVLSFLLRLPAEALQSRGCPADS